MREYLEELDRIGELRIIERADWDTQIGSLANLVAAKRGPAISIGPR